MNEIQEFAKRIENDISIVIDNLSNKEVLKLLSDIAENARVNEDNLHLHAVGLATKNLNILTMDHEDSEELFEFIDVHIMRDLVNSGISAVETKDNRVYISLDGTKAEIVEKLSITEYLRLIGAAMRLTDAQKLTLISPEVFNRMSIIITASSYAGKDGSIGCNLN
jgi:hypothetical protein